jgi:Protein of unknown function (DUF1365)
MPRPGLCRSATQSRSTTASSGRAATADGGLALVIYKGSQHLRRYPRLRASGEARRIQRCRHPAATGKAVLRLALHRDGNALSFCVTPPGERVRLRILETDRDGPLLAATFSGHRRRLTSAALLRTFFALPLVTFKIVAAIHWQAMRLWLKGMRPVSRPNAATANFNPALATGDRHAYTGPASTAVGRQPEAREGALVQRRSELR